MVKELQLALQEGGKTEMEENTVVTSPEEVETSPIVEPEVESEFKKKDEDEEEKKNPPSNSDEEKDDSEEDDEDEDKKGKKKFANSDEEEEEEKCPDCGKPLSECSCKHYNLEDIPEYAELQATYSQLKADYDALVAEIEPLRSFKAEAVKKDKQAMIDSFYMLSDEDKAEVVANMDNYSLDDIEAKLAIICVRNKVSFSLDNDKEDTTVDSKQNPMVYQLTETDNAGDNAPAWIKAVRDTAKNMI
jgi:hypothetical protein